MKDMDLRIIAAPLIGALIGYITNYVAIKMLFRPAHAKYIGNMRVPLTPGLIPKEKLRLARAVGEAVGEKLLDTQAVRQALLSPEMIDKVEGALNGLISRAQDSEETLGELLGRVSGAEKAAQLMDDGKKMLGDYLTDRLTQADLGGSTAASVAESLKKKAPGNFGEFISGILDDRVKNALTEQIRKAVNGYVERHAHEVVSRAVAGEMDKLANTRLCDLTRDHADKAAIVRDKAIELYKQLVEGSVEKALKALDISLIVQGKIEAINDDDLERMILEVADRELKAIVYLGAGLGFIMGFVNLLF